MKMGGLPIAVLFAASMFASPAMAEVQVRFSEGAPKDRFSITNTGACDLGPVDVTIDLSGSPAGLVFDVTGRGAGVEVFQPFEITSGGALLSSYPEVRDGDTSLSLNLIDLAPGQQIAFTIDVDNTLGPIQTTISDSEINGAGIRIETQSVEIFGTFDNTSIAIAPYQSCVS